MKTFKLVILGMVLIAAFAAEAQTSSNVSVSAKGFNNPRGLKFGPDGNLYVTTGAICGTSGANPFPGAPGNPCTIAGVNGGPDIKGGRVVIELPSADALHAVLELTDGPRHPMGQPPSERYREECADNQQR